MSGARQGGILQSEYNKLFIQQKGRCLICGEASVLHVDHDHITNEVRGLLCEHCNYRKLPPIEYAARCRAYLRRKGTGIKYRRLAGHRYHTTKRRGQRADLSAKRAMRIAGAELS